LADIANDGRIYDAVDDETIAAPSIL